MILIIQLATTKMGFHEKWIIIMDFLYKSNFDFVYYHKSIPSFVDVINEEPLINIKKRILLVFYRLIVFA